MRVTEHSEQPITFARSEVATARARIRIPVHAVAVAVWTGGASLIIGTFGAQLLHDSHVAHWAVPMLDSDQKVNAPSAGKIVLLLAATVLLALVAAASTDRWHRRRWLGMAAVFAFLSFDEMAYLHQRISDALHDTLDTQGALRFAWVLLYLPLVAVLAIVYLPFWWKLPSRLRWTMLVAALCFAGGSGGLELAKSDSFREAHWTLQFGLLAALSDSLELIGLALLVVTLLRYLSQTAPELEVELDVTSA